MQQENKGFTIIELSVVIAIIAIITAIGTPSLLEWRNKSNLRGAAFALKGDLEWAKSMAMRESKNITVKFDASGYKIKNLSTSDKVRRFPGIAVSGDDEIIFDNRKTAPTNGTVTLTIAGTGSRNVSVNRLGRISID